MGLDVRRIAQATKNMVENYAASFSCNKPLEEALEYIRGYMQPKKTKLKYRGSKYHAVNTDGFHITKDTNMNIYWEIEGAWGAHNVLTNHWVDKETMKFWVKYRAGVVFEVEVRVRAACAQTCWEEFKEDFLEAIPDLKGPAPKAAPQIAVAVDFTGVSMLQALEAFDKVIDQFGANVNESSFKKLRAFKCALTNKINSLPFQEKGKFSQPMGQIDMFVSTMEGQFANPAMASSVASFAGTYVAQMKAAVGSMASMA